MLRQAFGHRIDTVLIALMLALALAPITNAKTEETCESSKADCPVEESGEICFVLKTTIEGEPLRFEGTINETGGHATCVYGNRGPDGVITVQPALVGALENRDVVVGVEEPAERFSPPAGEPVLVPLGSRETMLRNRHKLAGSSQTCAVVCLSGALWAVCEKTDGPGSEARAAGSCEQERFDVTIREGGRQIKTIPLATVP